MYFLHGYDKTKMKSTELFIMIVWGMKWGKKIIASLLVRKIG